MIVPSFFVATAYHFWTLFRTPTTLQPPPPYTSLYVVASNTAIPFEKLFHGSYFRRTFLHPTLACLTCTCHAKADYVVTNAM